MFSKDVVSTRAFLEMPPSSRALYYQLGVEADDDGFVDPYATMLTIKATDDDLRVLLAKNFIIRFDSGVLVITSWKQNNMIRRDTYNETQYKNEKALLSTDINQKYYITDSVVNGSLPQYSIGKDSIGKDRESAQDALPLIKEKVFSSKKDITSDILQELSEKHEVPLPFVTDCWDSAQNWLLAKGKVMKDYRAFLENWVKREKANWLLKTGPRMGSRARGGVADARTR